MILITKASGTHAIAAAGGTATAPAETTKAAHNDCFCCASASFNRYDSKLFLSLPKIDVCTFSQHCDPKNTEALAGSCGQIAHDLATAELIVEGPVPVKHQNIAEITGRHTVSVNHLSMPDQSLARIRLRNCSSWPSNPAVQLPIRLRKSKGSDDESHPQREGLRGVVLDSTASLCGSVTSYGAFGLEEVKLNQIQINPATFLVDKLRYQLSFRNASSSNNAARSKEASSALIFHWQNEMCTKPAAWE